MTFYTTEHINELIKWDYIRFVDTHYIEILKNPNKYIEIVQQEIAKYLWWGYVKLLNSGTTALQLWLLSLWVAKGDEVILPANTYAATAIAVTNIGAIPVFCDINLKNFTLDVIDLWKKISWKTKVIIPVHLYGYACNMTEIMNVAQRKNIYVLEDASHAFSGKFWEKFLWTIWDIGIFSAHVSKNFWTLWNGGILFTKNQDIIWEVEKNIFPDKYFPNALLSGRTPANLGVFDAIVLLLKMKYLTIIQKENMKLFEYYRKKLSNNVDIISLPVIFSENESVRNFTCLIRNREIYVQENKWRIYYNINLSHPNYFWNTDSYENLVNTRYFFDHNFSFNFYYWYTF